MQPDIIAPGLNILAAWSEAASPLNMPSDHRIVKYHIDSGTSMSCPHVAAIATLLKAVHPRWSSAAIRSAMMTTGILPIVLKVNSYARSGHKTPLLTIFFHFFLFFSSVPAFFLPFYAFFI